MNIFNRILGREQVKNFSSMGNPLGTEAERSARKAVMASLNPSGFPTPSTFRSPSPRGKQKRAWRTLFREKFKPRPVEYMNRVERKRYLESPEAA